MSADITLTWLGHATVRIGTPAGKHVLVDPWLAGNPKCPRSFYDVSSDAILITHGHGDHAGDAVAAIGRCAGRVVGIVELCMWLADEGVPDSKMVGMNKGGTVALEEAGVTVTMTDARHSSSLDDGTGKPLYLGEAAGFVVGFSDGRKVYIAGDTCLFGDMEWIGKLYQPEAAILPIGDFYTMDPRAAAYACQLLGVRTVVPYHYGTFPVLRGTPEQLRQSLREIGAKTEVLALEVGVTTPLRAV
jgi:L-ascorbate metabolism protein UlaG (beta-lactamase superfamily)